MNKKRRRAGAGKRGGYLAANVPGLAHTDDHYPAAAAQHNATGGQELVVYPLGQVGHSAGLGLDHGAGEGLDGGPFIRLV